MKHLLGAALLALALVAGGCATRYDNATAWGQIATGVGAIIGETKIDPQIAKVSAKLAKYCTELQTAAVVIDALAPEKLQQAASDGRIALATFCARPPTNVAEAIAGVVTAYAAISAARAGG